MINREKKPVDAPGNVPADEDEADILDEVDAEPNEDGETQAFAADIRKAGAADAETVRENRRQARIADKKRKGEKVSFNTDDPLRVYSTLLTVWPASAMHVKMRRISGGPEVTELITRHPKDPTELFEALKSVHGQCAEATYEIWFLDTSNHQWRGKAKITLPDTRPQSRQNGNGHYSTQQPPVPTASAQPASPFALLQEALDTVQRLQGMQPLQQSAPQPASNVAQTPFALLQEALDTVQRLQGMQPSQVSPQSNEMSRLVDALQRVTGRGAPQQPQLPAPTGPQLPNTPAPPGYKYTWRPQDNCVVLEPENPAPARREPMPMYRGQREPMGQRPYYPQQGEQHDRYDPRQHQGPPDPLRESMSALRRAMQMREELDSLLGGVGQRSGFEEPLAQDQDPDSPVIIERTNDGEIIRNRDDGNIRGWDTLLVNLPNILKKGGEYIDKISKTAAVERQRRERVEQQLPPGFVRVTEGYEPPEGFATVPVRPAPAPRAREQDLPPPPAHVPPPIDDDAPEPPPPQRGWDENL